MSALTIYSDKDASQHQWHSTDAAEIAQQLN
ncbi:TPA: acireductone dioxygenase, partial [Enterobacter hormaechei subsp. xiangfangensis]|nr:acireductone dioxygenase [Enterobacter hormaechei subsp. xiangfangensis]